jgi:hypothetical protein
VHLFAVCIDRVDLHVGVRVDEVHVGEGSGQLQRHVHLELAETVVSQRWCGEANQGRCENDRPHDSV